MYNSLLDMIGNTPVMKAERFMQKEQLPFSVYVKLEGKNPAGSAKDRVAAEMIAEAERTGQLKPGAVIIEPTSGNTGIGLAAVAAVKGYRMILTMPDTMSVERIQLLEAYGAEVVLTPGAKGMAGAIEKAQELAKEYPQVFLPGQFENPSNPRAHYLTTGPEIYRDLDGKVDAFVACVGTGGTVSGVGEYLKEKKPEVKIIAVEPEESPLLSKGVAGPHKIQGIGANFIPENLKQNVLDEILTVSGGDAMQTARDFARCEGILVGISAGAALAAVKKMVADTSYTGKNVVVLLPDGGEKYLSTELFRK